MTKRENIGKSEIKVHVEYDSKKWVKAQDDAFNDLANNLELKGFRKGKVPIDKAKQEISQDNIWKKAIQPIVKEMGEEANKEITKDDKVVAGPFYQVTKITKSLLELVFSYALYPDFEIKNYKGLDVKFEVEKSTDKEVESELARVRERLSIWNVVHEPIKKGFKAKFDFEGFINNKPFSGGKAQNYELVIGSNKFIPGFEEAMTGFKQGDKKDVNVTFPKDYHDQKMAGKNAKFVVAIHEVYKKSVPELNDTLALEANVPNVKTLKELKVFIKKTISAGKNIRDRNTFKNSAFAILKKDVTITIPEALQNQEVQKLLQQFEADLKRQGQTIQDYAKVNNINPQNLIQKFKMEGHSRLTDTFIFADIANKEKISVTEEDYEQQYKKLAEIYSQSVDVIKKSITKQQLQIQLLNDKVIDLLIENRKK